LQDFASLIARSMNESNLDSFLCHLLLWGISFAVV
jgi:hypothetical protein